MPDPGRLLFCAGIAVYLAAVEGFQWRMLGRPGMARPLAAAALIVLWAVGAGPAAWITTALGFTIAAGACAGDRVGAGGAIGESAQAGGQAAELSTSAPT